MGGRTSTTWARKVDGNSDRSTARERADQSWANTRGYVNRHTGEPYTNKDGSPVMPSNPELDRKIKSGEAITARAYRTQKARDKVKANLLQETGGDKKAAESLRIARARAAGRKGAERRWRGHKVKRGTA